MADSDADPVISGVPDVAPFRNRSAVLDLGGVIVPTVTCVSDLCLLLPKEKGASG